MSLRHGLCLAALLWAAGAWAQSVGPQSIHVEDSNQHVFPGGIGLPGTNGIELTCNEIVPPNAPPTGETCYCKAGAGMCCKDSLGAEHCPGGGGGGGVTQINQGSGITLTPSPIVGTGTVAVTLEHLLNTTIFNDVVAGSPVQGDLITGNATPAWTKLPIGATNTALTSNGIAPSYTTINDATLANAYSGVGSCAAHNFATTLSRNAGPACTRPASTDLSDVPFKLLNTTLFSDTVANTVAQGDMIIGNATPAWTVLAPGAANTALTANGTTEAFTTVNDATLANAYGGVGTCAANNFVSATTRNSAPTCTQPTLGGLSGLPVHLLNTTMFNDVVAGSPTQGALVIGNATPAWTTLGAGGANTALTANGTTESFTTINDATLANAYSGVGTCTNQFPRTLTRNAAPTCASVNLTSDVTGTLPTGNGGTNNNTAPANDILIGDGTNWVKKLVVTAKGPQVYRGVTNGGFFEDTHVLYADDVIDCTGSTDATSGWATLVASINQNATFGTSTIYIPSGCIIRFKSPGAGNAAGTVPSNVHIKCDDETAGFAVDRQTCHGGTYPGAACNSSTECLGSGTCQDDFGNAAPGACTATTCFAPAAGTFTILKDTGAGSNDIFVENCSFFLAQASPYQACTGGTNAGDPCRQECDNASTTPGLRCETNADCGAGTCLHVADCHTPGGTCGGLPSKVPSGPGNIRAIDFSKTTRAKLYNVSAFDALTSDFTVQFGPFATLYNDNFAREVSDCTSPTGYVGASSSQCFGATANAGTCCYGAIYNGSISSGNKGNTQPSSSVTNQLVTGTDAQLDRVYARGGSAGVGYATVVGSRSHVEMSNIWPVLQSTDGLLANLGPGTPSGGGYSIADTSQITKSYALNLASNATCLQMNGANAGAIGVKCNGTSIAGVNMTGANSHALGMNIRGVGGSNNGATISGNNSAFSDSFLEGQSTTSLINVTGSNVAITGDVFNSNPVNTQDTGVTINPGANNGQVAVTGNIFNNMKTCSVTWSGAGQNGLEVTGNNSTMQVLGTPYSLTTLYATPTYHPNHVCLTASFTNNKIVGQNLFQGGTHGVMFQGAGSFGQTGIHGNRCFHNGGACFSLNGGQLAGINEVGNYVNAQAQGWTTSCDPSCSTSTCGVGGTQQCAGNPCNQDSDCGTCTATNKCIPDPVATDNGQAHFSMFGNLIFESLLGASPSQCTVAPVGQITDATGAGGVCVSGSCSVTQSGGPDICQSGADIGKRCCTSAGASVRTPTPLVRLDDAGTGVSATDMIIMGNQLFNMTTNSIGIDAFNAAGVTGTGTTQGCKITNNIFDIHDATQTGVIGIRLPTAFTSYDLSITNNDFKALAREASFTMPTLGILNYQGSMGPIVQDNGRIYTGTIQNLGTVTAITNFFPIEGLPNGTANTPPTTETNQDILLPGAATVWKMSCQTTTAPSNTSTRVQTLMVNGAASTMTCSISGTNTSCTTATGAASAPVAVPVNQTVALKTVSTVVTALAASQNLTCTIYVSLDTTM